MFSNGLTGVFLSSTYSLLPAEIITDVVLPAWPGVMIPDWSWTDLILPGCLFSHLHSTDVGMTLCRSGR